MGVGEAAQDQKKLQAAAADMTAIRRPEAADHEVAQSIANSSCARTSPSAAR